MRFCDDTELSIFLWRHFSTKVEMRKFVPANNESLTSRLEELVSEPNAWRFSESDSTKFIEDTIKNNCDDMLQKLKTCTFIVEKEREREVVDELLEIKVTVEPKKEISQNLLEPIRLLAAVISIAVYPKDIFSTSFTLSVLCPSVLPALKRLSASKKLNMALSLIAYIQKAVIDDNEGDDPVMKENIIFLKRFLKTIEDIHDKFDEMKDPRKGIRAGFEIANKFLLTNEFQGNSNMSAALKTVYLAIDEVSNNYMEVMQAAPNDQQTKPSFFNETERVCQSVVDRLTIMAPIMDVTSFSPNLRTPSTKSLTPARIASQPTSSENKKTPIASLQKESTTFINNQTPTPIRNPMQTIHDILKEEKENIDPNASGLLIEYSEKENKETPVRPPKDKGLRIRKSFDNTNEAKRAPTQRSIMSFFK